MNSNNRLSFLSVADLRLGRPNRVLAAEADAQRAKDGVRLLGSGEIKAKVAFSVWGASKSAVAAVEKAGGSVAILAPKRETGEQAA